MTPHGVSVETHECLLMYSEGVGWFHRAHRWTRGTFGSLPT